MMTHRPYETAERSRSPLARLSRPAEGRTIARSGISSLPFIPPKLGLKCKRVAGSGIGRCIVEYPNALEIGCANGVLTQRLAGHCDALLALDVSETALARATSRCATLGGVRFVRMNFPIEVPAQGEFDLIVLSEVAYYWNNADLALAASRLLALLAPGGDLILVHWTGETDYPQSGDSAVEALQGAMAGELERVRHEREVKYRLDLWRRWPE